MGSIRDLIVFAALIVSIPICFLRPTYGAILWVVMSLVNPQDFAWGWVRYMSPAMLIAIPTLVGFCVFCRGWKRFACLEVGLMVILWLWFTLTTFNSAQDLTFAEKAASAWYRWGLVSKILLMTAVTIAIIDNWKRFRWFVLAIAGSFGFLTIKTLPMMILSGGEARVYGPPNSMIADNNDFGLALNMALPFFLFLAKTETDRRIRLLMWVFFIVTIPAIIFTYSRGALVGLVAILLCMLLQAKQKLVLVPVAVFVLAFAGLVAPQAWRDRMKMMTPDSLDASAMSRLNAWQYSWNLAKDYPLMGGGFDAFTQNLFIRYAPNAQDVHGPHSIYFGVLAEHGFGGLFLYLTLVGTCFLTLYGIVRKARHLGDERSAHYANIFRIGLVGFLVSGAFLGRAYFDFYFSLVACIAILRQLCRAEWSRRASVEDETPEGMEEIAWQSH
jgi:probable O-glycosylation ligase (exosortase A-associated)